MNCMQGTVDASGTSVDVGVGSVPMPTGLAAPPAPGTSVIVGIRPEHLVLSTDGGLAIEVRAAEWLGHETLISAEIGGAVSIVRHPGVIQQAAGDQLRVQVDAAHVHLFDPATTERFE